MIWVAKKRMKLPLICAQLVTLSRFDRSAVGGTSSI
jgi:hypothetical protein